MEEVKEKKFIETPFYEVIKARWQIFTQEAYPNPADVASQIVENVLSNVQFNPGGSFSGKYCRREFSGRVFYTRDDSWRGNVFIEIQRDFPEGKGKTNRRLVKRLKTLLYEEVPYEGEL